MVPARSVACLFIAAFLPAPAAAQATVTWTTTFTTPYCAHLTTNCGGCWQEGCNYCEVSPHQWRDPRWLTAEEANIWYASLDYVCMPFDCREAVYMRPDAVHSRGVPIDECSTVTFPTKLTTATRTTTTQELVAEEEWVSSGKGLLDADPDKWPNTWGPLHWFFIATPILALCSTVACILLKRWKGLNKGDRRVHVAQMPPSPPRKGGQGFAATHVWDFQKAGSLHPSDIENASRALVAAARTDKAEASVSGRPVAKPRLSLWAENELKAAHLELLSLLLDQHPSVLLSLDVDWHLANDATLISLAHLLKRGRQRCHFRDTASALRGGNEHNMRLRLPAGCKPASLCAVAEALAMTSHAEVEELSIDKSSHVSSALHRPGGQTESVSVHLGPLRLSPQELTLRKMPVGDGGCAAACGFVRPWSARLRFVRMMECDLGDAGAAAVALLLRSAPNVRELNLSSNRIGDSGIAEVAGVLPSCDCLERLLLDRNLIGTRGAKALAAHLPRSNVKELVLGSHLGGNPLGTAGVEALAAALDDELPRAAADREHRLSALALEACQTGYEGALALAKTLPKSGLYAFSVARGDIGALGAQAVLGALPPGLMSLDLAGNWLGDDTAMIVGELFYSMPQLAVSLAQNCLSPEMRMLLTEEHGTRLRV